MTDESIEIPDDLLPGIPPPERCARREPAPGTLTLLADGRRWALAEYVPTLAPVWDRLHDANLIAGQYRVPDLLLAAGHLLRENYDLPPEAVAALLVGADGDALVAAVEAAMFGPETELRTWSDWALGSLYANGIDPATVPPPRLRSVLEILVASGRTVPVAGYVSAAQAAGKIAGLRARARAIPS